MFLRGRIVLKQDCRLFIGEFCTVFNYVIRNNCMENLKWIFFDLGSTLVDESECLKERCKVIIEQNNLDADEFCKKVLEYAEKDSFAISLAAQDFGVAVPKWFGELERLYPDVEEILKNLSQKFKLGIIANQVAGTQKRIDSWVSASILMW